MGRAVGVDAVLAGLMPADDIDAIRELASTRRVVMVGDGVNDAPAPARATVGIARGRAGTAAALETAGVALMGDELGRLPFALGLAVIIHEASTRTVVAKGLCLLGYHERGKGGEGRCGFAVASCRASPDRGIARVEGETPCPLWPGPVGRVQRRSAD